MEEIHHPKRNLNSFVNKVNSSEDITTKNKEHVFSFIDECYSRGLTDTRVLFYASKFWILRKWIKNDLDQLKKEDIIEQLIEKKVQELLRNKSKV